MGRHSELFRKPGSAPARGDDTAPISRQAVRPAYATAPAGAMRWESRFAGLVAAGDVMVVAACVVAGTRLGLTGSPPDDRVHAVVGVLGGVLMLVALPTMRAWEASVLGHGVTELARLGRAVGAAIVALGLGGLFLMVESVRLWVFGILPVTGVLCLASRFVLRKWLHRERGLGRCVLNVLAVGSDEAVADLIRRTRRDPYFGWHVAGACTPTGYGPDGSPAVAGVPVVGDLDSVAGEAVRGRYRVVAVCRAAAGWGPARLHRLAWDLESSDADLAVDPGLMEVAGPRMHVAPIDGLPLLRLSRPRFTGGARVLKTALDRFTAALLIVVLSPVLVGVAAAVWLGDRGPVFFRQSRIGVHGRTFGMVKFRSMCVDAERLLPNLAAGDDGAGPLFKMRRDPRITRVGRLLRRYSLDELPQLFNVLAGSMSLVGPRPPLPTEVVQYADDARRRLLVPPGMTGLWQVSGRSTLSWEETVRLDLRYVENWSLALDMVILWKTVGAVVRGRGAY